MRAVDAGRARERVCQEVVIIMPKHAQQKGMMIFTDYQKSSFWIFMEFFPNLTCFKEPISDNDSKEIQEKNSRKRSTENIIGR